jgi:5-methylcytosine-specific restriction enzyme subunit McrC
MVNKPPVLTSDCRTVYSIDSRGSLELDFADLMVGGELSIFKEVDDLGLLFLRFQRRKIIIAAGGYIGLIPLTPTVTIEVNPKLPVRNLARVLDVARSSLQSLASTDRMYLVQQGTTGSVLAFLAANLLDASRQLEIHGLHKQYGRRLDVTSHPSGRIDISSSLQKFWSKGQTHKISVERFEQTSDIAVNRVVKGAMLFVLQRLKPISANASMLIKQANRAFFQFPASIGDMTMIDLEEAKDIIERRRLPGQRGYYYRVLEIAVLILTNGGIALQEKGNDVLLRSFIVNFDDLFESYIRRVLQSNAKNEISVLDGNHEGKKPLFHDKNDPPAQPDIVVVSNITGKCVVADVKYKDGAKRDDINQAVTYAASFGTDRTMIIHQMKPGAKSGINHIGTIGAISVDTYAFNLDSDQLQQEEEDFVKAIFALTA